MSITGKHGAASPPRVLVAIASYGTSNDRYLEQIIREYRSMAFAVDIVVLSNIEKALPPGVECVVGLPTRDPWSLPFAHKKLFASRRDLYDLFIYSENDMLITERNLLAWLEVNALLQADEIAGFLRFEYGSDGELNYPDVHAHFHWDASSVRRRGEYTLAHFTNEHAACYVLTREQLHRALESGGFDVAPHEGKYDLACTAATDPYTQCGFTKLIPICHLRDFTVHHMSNRYVGRMGVNEYEFGRQIDALLQIAEQPSPSRSSLIPTETRLWHVSYSKDYYEPVMEQITSVMPGSARSVLSIGCGSGATESWLVERGFRVAAIPLDPVIAGAAAANGVEMLYDAPESDELEEDERFDCVLCLNILHLAREPERLLSLSHAFMHKGSVLVVQAPNMMSPRGLRSHLRGKPSTLFGDYESKGTHFSSARTVRNWCANSGFKIEKTLRLFASRRDGINVGDYLPGPLSSPLATSIIVTATKSQDKSATSSLR